MKKLVINSILQPDSHTPRLYTSLKHDNDHYCILHRQKHSSRTNRYSLQIDVFSETCPVSNDTDSLRPLLSITLTTDADFNMVAHLGACNTYDDYAAFCEAYGNTPVSSDDYKLLPFGDNPQEFMNTLFSQEHMKYLKKWLMKLPALDISSESAARINQRISASNQGHEDVLINATIRRIVYNYIRKWYAAISEPQLA